MITLPVWFLILVILPSILTVVTISVLAIAFGVKEACSSRREFKEESEHPITRAFRFGEEAIERKCWEETDKSAEGSDELYIPVCPCGYDDCIWDPARIKHDNPEWYKRLYGDLTPEEAIHVPNGCFARFQRDPSEEYYCWDDEEK